MRHLDTKPEALAVYRQCYERLSGEERVLRAFEMAEEAKRITLDGIRSRNPTLDADAVDAQWLELMHGPELARELMRRRAS